MKKLPAILACLLFLQCSSTSASFELKEIEALQWQGSYRQQRSGLFLSPEGWFRRSTDVCRGVLEEEFGSWIEAQGQIELVPGDSYKDRFTHATKMRKAVENGEQYLLPLDDDGMISDEDYPLIFVGYLRINDNNSWWELHWKGFDQILRKQGSSLKEMNANLEAKFKEWETSSSQGD